MLKIIALLAKLGIPAEDTDEVRDECFAAEIADVAPARPRGPKPSARPPGTPVIRSGSDRSQENKSMQSLALEYPECVDEVGTDGLSGLDAGEIAEHCEEW